MNKAEYVIYDLETGGIETHFSLLTGHFIVADKDLYAIDELALAIRPKDGIYMVSAKALGVNGIDLVKHDREAVSVEAAADKLYHWLEQHSNSGKNKLVPVGHNVIFDEQFVHEHRENIRKVATSPVQRESASKH